MTTGPRIVFDDAEVRAIFHPAPEPTAARPPQSWLLVTFAPRDMTADGLRFWGEKIAAKAGIDALGIVAKRPNWYPAASMAPLREAAGPLLAGFHEIVTYGASMGGYGALKYGAALGAQTAIAICPQASIDPADTVPVKPRSVQHFRPELHAGMRVAPGDLPARSHIFFDPFQPHDDRQVALLRDVAPAARVTRVPMSGHETIHLFAGTEIATSLIEACRRDDLTTLRALVSKQRRTHWLRLATTARMAALRGRTALARRLLERRGEQIPAPQLIRLHGTIADRLFRQRQAAGAGWFLDQLECLAPEDPSLAPLRRDFALAQGDRTAALAWARRAATAPGHEARLTLANLLLKARELEEAATLIGTLRQERPSDARILMAQSDLLHKRGDLAGALACVTRAAALEPGWASIQRQLAALRTAAEPQAG
jgi:hypothetical protein